MIIRDQFDYSDLTIAVFLGITGLIIFIVGRYGVGRAKEIIGDEMKIFKIKKSLKEIPAKVREALDELKTLYDYREQKRFLGILTQHIFDLESENVSIIVEALVVFVGKVKYLSSQ